MVDELVPFHFSATYLEIREYWKGRAFSIQSKIPEILVGTSNGTDSFGLVRLEYSGPALKVVLFDWSGHFSQLDWKVPFLLTKLLSPVLLFCFLLTRTITEHAEKWNEVLVCEHKKLLDKKCFLRTLEIVFQGIRWMPPTSFPLAAHPFSTCVINNYSSVGKNILILHIQKVEQSVSQAPQQKCYWACPLFLQTRDIYQ